MKGITLLAIASVLILGILGVAFAAESIVPAQVVVNSFTSVTITPCAGTLSFGSGNPGANDLPVACQGAGTSAVNVANGVVSNTNIAVETKGTDFANVTSIAVNKAEFDEDNAKATPTTLSTSYQTSTASVAPGSSAGIWYWLDIPSGQAAGTYSGTLSVRGQ